MEGHVLIWNGVGQGLLLGGVLLGVVGGALCNGMCRDKLMNAIQASWVGSARRVCKSSK
jgi:hypothetical protein